jgi:hypothetical protein
MTLGVDSKKKRTKQVTECIPSGLMTKYEFYFSFQRKKFEINMPILIEIKNVKSLDVISIGTFSFEFNKETNIKSC